MQPSPPRATTPIPDSGATEAGGPLDFVAAVVRKAERDQIFFMASAISFAILIAVLPLLLLLAGVGGLVLARVSPDPTAALIDLVVEWMPQVGGEGNVRAILRDTIAPILDDRTGLTLVGALLLLWFSSRLVGTVRTVLLRIFEVEDGPGIVRGKLHDLQVIIVGGALLLANLGITAGALAVRDMGIGAADLQGQAAIWIEGGSARFLAFLSIWLLLLGLYRYLPGGAVQWRTALVAATFTAVAHELLKSGFGWYVASIAEYRTAYGNLISLAVLFFWIHYTSISFILGGEVAWTWARRRQRRLDAEAVA